MATPPFSDLSNLSNPSKHKQWLSLHLLTYNLKAGSVIYKF
jgi:hypothetical protein